MWYNMYTRKGGAIAMERLNRIVSQIQEANIGDEYRNSNESIETLGESVRSKLMNQAKNAADSIADYFWTDEGAAFKIGSLMEALNFKVYSNDEFGDDTLSGILALNANKVDSEYGDKLIVVNGNDNVGHQRFTIAHELAHFLFDAKPGEEYYEAFYRTSVNDDVLLEFRANQFAANLLMPEKRFKERYMFIASKIDDPNNREKILSIDFGVSPTAVRRRIKELNLAKEVGALCG